jgi:aspartyl/asparaginyl-tRNA synthetase
LTLFDKNAINFHPNSVESSTIYRAVKNFGFLRLSYKRRGRKPREYAMESIRDLLARKPDGTPIVAKGWVRTKREAKNAVFLELNDGSCMANLQCVFDASSGLPDDLRSRLSLCGTGASAAVSGTLVTSPAAGQAVELKASSLEIIGKLRRIPILSKRKIIPWNSFGR